LAGKKAGNPLTKVFYPNNPIGNYGYKKMAAVFSVACTMLICYSIYYKKMPI